MGWFARAELRTVAPIFSPPPDSGSSLSWCRRLMSMTSSGRSTFSFIRSSKVVPPATKRVPDFAPAAIAASASSARWNSNDRISAPRLGLAAGLLDGRDDVGIGAATTDVAAHAFADIGIARPAGLLEQRDRRHDLAAGAIAALIGIVRDERRLHRMQGAGLSDTFYRRDLVALVHHGEAQARVHPPAVDMHGAGAALAVVAAFLGAGQVNGFAQAIQERRARVEAQPVLAAIDTQNQGYDSPGIRGRRGRIDSGVQVCLLRVRPGCTRAVLRRLPPGYGRNFSPPRRDRWR